MNATVKRLAQAAPSAEAPANRGRTAHLARWPGNRCAATGALIGPGSRRRGQLSHRVNPVAHPCFR